MNNTILNNSGGSGGCVVFLPIQSDSSSSFANSVIAGNSAGVEVNDLAPFDFNCVFANGTNDFIGVASPVGVRGNISADPLLATDPSAMGALLASGSPCRNAGDNDFAIPNINDLFGHNRIAEGRVDMGAH